MQLRREETMTVSHFWLSTRSSRGRLRDTARTAASGSLGALLDCCSPDGTDGFLLREELRPPDA